MPRQVPLPLPTPRERLIELERKVRELDDKVRDLEAKLVAENAVTAAVAQGEQTIASIVAALRKQGDELMKRGEPGQYHIANFARRIFFGERMYALANEIQKQAETDRRETMLGKTTKIDHD